MAWQGMSSQPAVFAVLLGRTEFVTVRAKHTAVPRLRSEEGPAADALVKIHATVRRHDVGHPLATCRTGHRHFEIRHSRSLLRLRRPAGASWDAPRVPGESFRSCVLTQTRLRLPSSRVISMSRCPTSSLRKRSVTRRLPVCGCPPLSSQVRSLKPELSTTRVSRSHLPVEYPSHVGCGSVGSARSSRKI